MRLTIKGRPIPKKNRRIIKRSQGGRPYSFPSKAYTRFKEIAGWQLKSQYKGKPLKGDLAIKIVFYVKGKYKVDGDNLMSSIFDILEDFHIVENDEQFVWWLGLKKRNCEDWKTEIMVRPLTSI